LSTDLRKKNTQTADFTIIRPVGAELFHVDGHKETWRSLY